MSKNSEHKPIEELSFDELEKRFISLFKKSIPPPVEKEKSIFDIMGKNHDELTFSNIFAYFLDSKEDHDLGCTFINALVELVRKTDQKVTINPGVLDQIYNNYDLNVSTEKPVKSGRIDILIETGEENEAERQGIVIENKIFAAENNPLTGYRNDLPYNLGHSQGIVISRTSKREFANGAGYVNILYQDLLDKAMFFGGSYLNEIQYNRLFLLKEAMLNNKNNSERMEQAIKDRFQFYIENFNEINELSNLREDIKSYLIDTTEKTLSEELGYELITKKDKSDIIMLFKTPNYEHNNEEYKINRLNMAYVYRWPFLHYSSNHLNDHKNTNDMRITLEVDKQTKEELGENGFYELREYMHENYGNDKDFEPSKYMINNERFHLLLKDYKITKELFPLSESLKDNFHEEWKPIVIAALQKINNLIKN